ncbi:peptide deformylase [Streptococcus sp. HF-1907]|uniref:peptide deformylase n=1 Tax=Streptococcus sp. HF-1907 TaxID=2785793 RepID=UPI00189CFA1B|nr:peptide deformylase [Streptococcus sp. HF-1907]MBF7094150.1 peptide deformylase [Streptococcus sp. HF-1907]
MIKPIIRDTFFLQQKSLEATKSDLSLAKDLQDALAANREVCVGMAANMIGSLKRVIIINIGFTDLVMFNPILVDKAQPYDTEELCLSLVGVRPTKRYRTIKVSYRDINWQEKTITLTDFPAQVCQHELDHLEGILI